MDLFSAMRVGGSGLAAQRVRLNLAAENLANANTTQTPEGGPYRAKRVVLHSSPGQQGSADFEHYLRTGGNQSSPEHVQVTNVVREDADPRQVYDPSHPDADEEGFVAMPNIDVSTQMVDMMEASRSYRANTLSIKAAREMAMHALQIGK
ncbi:flagellar basal body rod protein FlgC [Thiohalorhabdus methylotrophus]|uniref:Flagellar basal-body rod protein FlgC n=1 Tax=Thiohalorhabdus methylotrophus TaxID=3242694 RepID=A0ABV4TY36_9GAMM